MTPETPYWFCNEDDLTDSDIDQQESGKLLYHPEVTLFKLSSGDFQVSQTGSFKAILNGPGYVLIRRDIAMFVSGLFPTEVNIKDVRIFRKSTNEEWNSYSEISIKKNIDFKGYDQFRVDGLHIYTMYNSLIYVSSNLKDLLIDHFPNLDGMVFKQGIPIVGGSNVTTSD